MEWLTRICYNVYRATTEHAYHAGLGRKAREMIDAGPHKGIIKAEYRAMAKWMREGAYEICSLLKSRSLSHRRIFSLYVEQ